jgi:hypothetical protein
MIDGSYRSDEGFKEIDGLLVGDLKIFLHNSFKSRLDEIEKIILTLCSQVSQAVHHALP